MFSVADGDKAAARAERLGAQVLDRRDTLWTREADLGDPQGAARTVSQFAPRSDRWD